MERAELTPIEGSTEMHNGSILYWKTNAAGGRTFYSDEIPTGVCVWDTCLVGFDTLCEAISIEMALRGVERRAEDRAARGAADA